MATTATKTGSLVARDFERSPNNGHLSFGTKFSQSLPNGHPVEKTVKPLVIQAGLRPVHSPDEKVTQTFTGVNSKPELKSLKKSGQVVGTVLVEPLVNEFQITVKNLMHKGGDNCFTVRPSDTVDQLKNLVHNKWGIRACEQVLVYRGKTLTKGKTLRDYNMHTKPNEKVMLTARMEAG